jgi:hypothetical protein
MVTGRNFRSENVIRRASFFAAILLLTEAWGSSSGNGSAEKEAPSQKLALLVGVQQYKVGPPEFSSLSGCVNDVADIEQMLITKYGFQQSNIKTLLNKQATHRAIIKAFQQQLIAKATEHSAVVFFYSGHGSQMKDREREETDGWDETICPYDTRTPGIFDISDDEIAGLLSQLLKKTSNVTLIFDSCHSGSMSRGTAIARKAPPDKRDPPPAPSYAIAAKGIATLSIGTGAKPTVISACLADQSSYEFQCADVMRGDFTYHLVRQLWAAGPRTTIRDILEQTRPKVAEDVGNQQPDAEGNLDRAPFGESITTQEPYFLVRREGKRLSLSAGLVHGLTPGSLFDIFPPETKTFKATPLGQVRLSKVTPFKADAELVGEAKEIPDLARAVEREHSFGETPFRVSMQITGDKLRSQVEAAIKMIAGITNTAIPGESSVLIAEAGDQLKLLDPSATVEFASLPKGGVSPELISTALRRWSSWISAVRTSNPAAVFKGEFRVSTPGGTRGSKGWFSPEQTFRDGDDIEIYVKNASDQPLYFTLLDFSSDGSISQIYPPPGAREVLAPQREWKQTTAVKLPAGKKRIRDILKVVLSRQPVDFSPLLVGDQSLRELVQSRGGVEPIGMVEPEKWVTSERIFDVDARDQ